MNTQEITIASKSNHRDSIQLAHGGITRGGEEVLRICEEYKIPLIPYFSLFPIHAQKG